MKNIMLDLETLGNKPGAVIVAIGAVRFGGGELGNEFYVRVDAQSCVHAGLKLDVSTVLWWMKQSAEARAELLQEGSELAAALCAFTEYAMSASVKDNTILWGNGSDFDNALLLAAYEACQLIPPWKFYNNRCYRTVKNLHPEIKLTRTGTAHNALDDAKSQALHLMQMCPEI